MLSQNQKAIRQMSLDSSHKKESRIVSVESFLSKKTKPTKHKDRMVFSIEKNTYEWSTVKKNRQKTGQKIRQSKDFQDYLTDNLSDDSQSIKEFLHRQTKTYHQKIAKKRKISTKPFKQTIIHGWKDNFYTNLLDWHHQKILFAARGNILHQFKSLRIDEDVKETIIPAKASLINSIKCSPCSNQLAIAFDTGLLQHYDFEKERQIISTYLHYNRITALDWADGTILTGSKDRNARIWDPRTLTQAFFLRQVHCQEVLGIKRLQNLVATGGNDNLVALYDLRMPHKILGDHAHQAAVKSLAWIKSSKTLLSGGGTSDKMLKFWNTNSLQITRQIDTGSQVCNIVLSKNSNQFVTCQGFSQNQIVLWSIEGQRLQTLHGQHKSRVLYCAQDPQGEYIATGAGDKNLYLWKMFPPSESRRISRFISDDLR